MLTIGQSGNDAYELQRELVSAGYYHYTDLDGSFGLKTLAAVQDFQRANGLKVDGSVGPQTWAAILGGQYVQGKDTQGRYTDKQWALNERKQQAAGGKLNWTTITAPTDSFSASLCPDIQQSGNDVPTTERNYNSDLSCPDITVLGITFSLGSGFNYRIDQGPNSEHIHIRGPNRKDWKQTSEGAPYEPNHSGT